MYRSMNSLSVSSVCDHSSSVYRDPTSTGTVRQPATVLKYSMLCRWGGNECIKPQCSPAAYFCQVKNEKKKKVLIQDPSTAQKCIMWMSSSPAVRAAGQMPGAVCQLSAVSGEGEDSEGYLEWRGSNIRLRCQTLQPVNQECCDE